MNKKKSLTPPILSIVNETREVQEGLGDFSASTTIVMGTEWGYVVYVLKVTVINRNVIFFLDFTNLITL
jgi:hypothetical protein